MVGGGILPVAVYNGKLHFLFGEESDERRWIDFGGGSKPGETLLQTVVRECCEELDGFFGTHTEIRKLIRENQLLKLQLPTYTSFLVAFPYDANLPFYFNNHHKFIQTHLPHLVCKKGFFEKRQIKWMTFDEIKQKRPHFRQYYTPLLDLLQEQEAFLLQAMRQRT